MPCSSSVNKFKIEIRLELSELASYRDSPPSELVRDCVGSGQTTNWEPPDACACRPKPSSKVTKPRDRV